MVNKVLVIGDAHVDEHQDLRRFEALGNFINKERPDTIVIIGDFLTLNCLSNWDRDKRLPMEGLRYHKEIDAGNEALDLMLGPYCADNAFKAKSKKKTYTPSIYYLEGNHEDRLTRFLEKDPTFLGTVGIQKDLMLSARDIIWVPYKQDLILNGVSFTHIPITGAGKPIANPTVAQKALRLYANSVVFGHTHTLDHAAEHRHNGKHLNQALSVGCFFEHTDAYAQGSKTDYWRGIVMLDMYSENRFDVQTIAMSNLLSRYGNGSSTSIS